MKRKIFLSAGILFFTFFNNIAKAENVTQYLVEKRISVDRKTGFILASDLKRLQDIKPRRATLVASHPVKISKESIKKDEKVYSILNDGNTFNSIILVSDTNGNPIKRISVGRQAMKIITSSKTKHLFVLCGGYFGSVWEIDPEKNQVIKKFATSWNPTDISLDSSEKFLYVTSGKLQRFNVESDVLLETDLPPEIKYLSSVNLVNNSFMIFGGLTRDNTDAYYTLNESLTKIISTDLKSQYAPSIEISVNAESEMLPAPNDIVLIFSRNNDFIYLFSLSRDEISGIIPLDSKADELIVMPKQNKAFALHRIIGEVSVIDLTPQTSTQFSVVARIMDERLKDPTNTFVLEGNKVFIKSDSAQEGYIDQDNILRFTSPIVEIPFSRDKEIFMISTLANKRYYLKNNQLFYEELNDNSLNYARKIRLSNFGNSIGGIDLSKDGKYLYISDFTQNMIITIDTTTNKIFSKIIVGSEPEDIVLYKNYLYVLNRGDQTISTVDLKTSQIIKVNRLKVENNNLNIVKLYDKDFDQIIKVTLASEINKELTMLKIETN